MFFDIPQWHDLNNLGLNHFADMESGHRWDRALHQVQIPTADAMINGFDSGEKQRFKEKERGSACLERI